MKGDILLGMEYRRPRRNWPIICAESLRFVLSNCVICIALNQEKMKSIFTLLTLAMSLQMATAQIGIGLTASNDFYHYYQNPEDNTGESTSAGSALMNFGVGPKVWFGTEDFSISVEGQAVLGVFGLSARDYKGLGTVAYPLMAKFNFGGLSALDKEGKFGWSLGAGMQYSRTELYYTTDDFDGKGGVRDLVRTYVGQVGYGFGMSGFTAHGFVRFGYDPDSDAKVFNIGVQYDFNIPKLRKISDPASEL